jgi:hypothetical protein
MAGEWMGAFLWIAMRKAGIEFPSFIPTWGVVVVDDDPKETPNTNGHPTNNKVRLQPTMVGTNGTDDSFLQTIVGVVMPLVKFETIKEMTKHEPTDRHDCPLPTTPLGLARMMLPTVETLLFVEQMGMSFQDLSCHKRLVSQQQHHQRYWRVRLKHMVIRF